MPSHQEEPDRLDQINTQWSLMRLAHAGSLSLAGPARNVLAMMYRRAIRAYVGALVHNAQDADELAQDVLVRLLGGSFQNANPDRGRFRDMLKVAVRNLVRNFWSRQARRSADLHELDDVADDTEQAADAEWTASWRSTLLDNVWSALLHYEQTHKGSIAHTVLRLRADNPDDDSPQLAARLSAVLGKPVRPDALRQQLHRARLRFAQLLLENIARSIDPPTPERVEEELADLALMEYVREFLPDDWRETGELKVV